MSELNSGTHVWHYRRRPHWVVVAPTAAALLVGENALEFAERIWHFLDDPSRGGRPSAADPSPGSRLVMLQFPGTRPFSGTHLAPIVCRPALVAGAKHGWTT